MLQILSTASIISSCPVAAAVEIITNTIERGVYAGPRCVGDRISLSNSSVSVIVNRQCDVEL